MPKAIWNGAALAESSEGHVVEGIIIFRPSQSNESTSDQA